MGHLEREQPYLGDLLTMVVNHLPSGMILKVLMGLDFLFEAQGWRWTGYPLDLEKTDLWNRCL